MSKFFIKRLLILVPILLGVTFIIFALLYFTPGDPVSMMLSDDATPEAEEALRDKLGLNDPFFVRYFNYVKNIVVHGDFGTSYRNNQPVIKLILERFPKTIILATAAATVSVSLGLLLGTIAGVKQYSFFDNSSMILALLGVSIPHFWLGLLLMLAFSLKLGWLPVSGFTSFKHVILPAVTIGLNSTAIISRMTRSSVLDVIRQDYIDTARAKGQREVVVILDHGLRNALIPIITAVGIQFGILLGGAVITESVFAIPGLGKLMIDSIKLRDYPTVQGCVLFTAFVFSIVNLLVDILYAWVDPRIKANLIKK